MGLLERLQQRNDELKSLRDNSPESYASRITKSFKSTLDSFGSKQQRADPHTPKLVQEMTQQGSQNEQSQRMNLFRSQQQLSQGKAQISATNNLDSSTRLGTTKITGALGEVILELRRGFKSLKYAQGGGILDMLPGGKKRLPGGIASKASRVLGAVKTAGALAAGGYAAYQGFGNAQTLFDSKKTGAEKVTAGAHLLTSGAGAALGGIFGGPQGAAFGAAAGEALASAGDSVGKVLAGSIVGDTIGRGIAVAMSPFSEDARQSLKLDYQNIILPAMTKTFGPVIGAISSFGESVKKTLADFWQGTEDTAKNLVEAGSQLKGGVKAAAGAVWGGVKAAAKQVAKGDVSGAVSTVKKASSKGYEEVVGAAKVSAGLARGRYNEQETASIQALASKGEKFRGGKGLTADTKSMITEVARKSGVDPTSMLTMAQIESAGNANAVSATGAAGLYQFTGGTGRQYGIKNRFDPKENTEAAARFMKDNAAALKKRGIDATTENLYLAHQQGVGGAAEIINAASGKGTLSAKTAENMRLNFGQVTPQEYLEINRKKVAAATARVTTETYAGSYNNADSKVAATTSPILPTTVVSPKPTVAAKPVSAKPTVVAKTTDNQKPLVVTPKPSSLPLESPKPVVATHTPMGSTATPERVAKASVAPVQKVSKSTPAEMMPVKVMNEPQEKPEKSQPSVTMVKSRQSSSVPSLDEIPPFFPDLALASIMLGRV